VIPVININLPSAGNNSLLRNIAEVNLPEIKILASASGSGNATGFNVLFMIYLAGLVFASVSFIISLSGILLLILTKPSEGRLIRFSSQKHTCFSAFGYIFLATSVSKSDAERMIAHELNHIRKNHFADLVIVTVVGIIQWFNPALYSLRKSLQAVHEYEADEECINHGEDIKSYQSLLVSSAFSTNIPILTNKFSNKSLLKKRIIMMTKKKTGSFSSIKMLLALPLAALMFFAFSCNKSGEKQDSAISSKPVETINGEPIFIVCEQMPSFPGGDAALLNYISSNVVYPKPAIENGIQGKVVVRFCITKEGNVDMVSVARGVDPILDKEAIRVVKSLPSFAPGKQNGKDVNTWYSLPINFALK